ncbi:MAG: energy transducer TonB [Acidobacteriaceae bacterium]
MNRIITSAHILTVVAAIVFGAWPLFAQDGNAGAMPDSFVVARHTFFDFGPPSDFYEIYVVSAVRDGSFIEKLTLPPGASCYLPAKSEYNSVTVPETVATILEKNPCNIAEKQVQRELKRKKKHQLVFSGANVAIQLQCGSQVRTIRADILDRDLFDSNAATPQHTSWTMRLLGRLDTATGPNAMDKPAFSPSESEPSAPPDFSRDSVQHLTKGDFDALFTDAPDRPSAIFQQSQLKLAQPTANFTSIEPVKPEISVNPKYPPLAKAARISGAVEFKAKTRPDGTLGFIEIVSGHPTLIPAATEAINQLRFAETDIQREVTGRVEFNMNCSPGDYHSDPVQKTPAN